ncbi:MAG: phytanoyl-CoA dioxygenase family protein [Abditibacteriaceae bacterium]
MTTSQPRLSPEQVEQYKREGYLIYNESVLPPAQFDKLKAHFEEKLTNLPKGYRSEAMDVPHFADPALFEWLFAPEVLDLIEPLIGPNIALFSSHFISKPKGNGKRVPWHEDSSYWRGRLDPMEVVTVWLAIDPATPENGCMYVIPRTQHNGYSDYDPVDPTTHVFPTEIKKEQRDDTKAVPCILEPNEASLHHAKLMHGSPPNTSSMRRCGYTMRYIPTSVKCEPGNTHQIYLARGRDLAGNVYADHTKAYPELALYREKHKTGGH